MASSTIITTTRGNCTCEAAVQHAPVVDLLLCSARTSSSSISDEKTAPTTTNKRDGGNNKDDSNASLLLANNLGRYGWSLLRVDPQTLLEKQQADLLSSTAKSLLEQPAAARWKEIQQELFRPDIIVKQQQDEENNNNPQRRARVTWIEAESGSPDTPNTEPKQSWEILWKDCCYSRNKDDDNNDNNDPSSPSSSSSSFVLVYERMKGFAEILRTVAIMARQLLQLPEQLLLDEETTLSTASPPPTTTTSSCTNTSGQRLQQDDPLSSSSSSLDLLRAFSYDVVSEEEKDNGSNNNSNTTTLGSNPHTDWGSFTVVWQDDIGGLETYCPVHQRWIPVPTTAPPSKKEESSDHHHYLYFVIHVGDLLSLAMARCVGSSRCCRRNNIWPSPRHRVCSPTGGSSCKRNSLVYFAYPPRDATIDSLAKGLANWYDDDGNNALGGGASSDNNNDQQQQEDVIPYNDYFLLRNQSLDGGESSSSSTSSEERFHQIVNVPIGDILRDKWRQVQRGS